MNAHRKAQADAHGACESDEGEEERLGSGDEAAVLGEGGGGVRGLRARLLVVVVVVVVVL